MILSESDKREVCPLHGWVGRRAFQRDRHDLCEAPEESPSDVDTELDEDESADNEDEHDDEDAEDVIEPARWSRASARARGIPPKKTIAVRRITQEDLSVGRAELQVLGADEPYDRPKTRSACQWCSVCQLVRDGKSDGSDDVALRALRNGVSEEEHDEPRPRSEKRRGRLACGHLITEVIHRSRPCVFIACKHALYLDISETGSIIFNFPHLEPGQMPVKQSCSLDLADRGGMTLEEIAVVTNLTRERIRQVEVKALLRRARPAALTLGLGPADAAAAGTRRLVGPGADLAETGVDGELPSDVASILGTGTSGGNRGGK
jgi:hypothetical protein